MASRRKQQHLPGIEPGVDPIEIEIEIPTMGWEQVGGDRDPGAYGGTIAMADGDHIELIKIQPVRDHVGDEEAKEVGFPFWTRTASFNINDLNPNNRYVKSALDSIGMDFETLEADFTPVQRALVIAEALLDYGRGDDGPSGWSADIGIPDEVKWQSGEVAGAEYLADEDEAFRDDVLGYGDIRNAIEEKVGEMADRDEAMAWSTPGDQMLSDVENDGFDPETVVSVSEFGEAVAVNGDLTDETISVVEAKLEADGYEHANGGSIPSSEAEVSADHVVDAVARELGRDREDVEKAAESLDWWQENIPWSVSGYSSVWAKRKEEDEDTTIYITPTSRNNAEKRSKELERAVGVDISLGDGDYINIYSRDPIVIDRAVKWLGTRNVVEISPDPHEKTNERNQRK
jgi:hypothetical protein